MTKPFSGLGILGVATLGLMLGLPELVRSAAAETQTLVTVTTYRQDLASAGKVERIEYKDGAGNLLRQVDNTWEVRDGLPYRARNIATENTQHFENGSVSRTTRVERTFNDFGRVVKQVELGDKAVTGDERTTMRWSYPNTSTETFLVDRWAVETVNAGADYDVTQLLSRTHYYYDNQALTAAPTKGNLTQVSQWKGPGANDYVTTASYSYDSHGNVITETDALGNVTQTAYDTTLNLYPVSVTNALGQVTQYSYNAACGLPASMTDLNGQVTSYGYDGFCREILMTGPLGETVETAYVDFGDPALQHVQRVTKASSAGVAITQRVYFDGLGRKTKNWTSGDTPSLQTWSYDARGNLATESLPYLDGATPQLTRYDYDALDRLTRTIAVDNTETTVAYYGTAPFAGVETTDALGRKARILMDGLGRQVRKGQFDSDNTWVETTTSHDLLDRVVGVTDPLGAQWSYSFNGLGQRTVANDPDLGTWSYVYDNAGNLTDRTDAKGQVNRLLQVVVQCI